MLRYEQALRPALLDEQLNFAQRPLAVPAKLGRHRARHARRRATIGRAQFPRRQQPEPRTAQQDVADGARLLVARRERSFGEQVGKAGNDLLSELATARGRSRTRSAT